MGTHYETLGLQLGASLEEVKAAYRALARQEHPDVSPRPDASERFRAIQEAYEALSDERRRLEYDRSLQAKQSDERERRRREREAREAEELRRKAEALMREAAPRARIDPEEVRRLAGLLNGGRFADAERMAGEMLLRESRQPVPYAVLGDLARMRGELARALEMYGYAAQYEPSNPIYQRKYEEVLAALSDPSEYRPMSTALPMARPAPLVAAGFVYAMGLAYMLMARESPARLPVFGSWTAASAFAMVLAGVATGAGLSLSGAVARFRGVNGSAVFRVPPVTLIALVSLLSFWAAAALYFVIGSRQQAFNRSLSLTLGVCGLVTVLSSLLAWSKGPELTASLLVFGGNLVFAGAALAWAACDGLRGATNRAA